MSAEAEVSAAIDKPVDQNAQSAEDVKKMLAELEGEAQTKDTSKASAVDSKSEEKTNGDSTESKEETTEVREDKKVEISAHNRRGDRDSDDRGRYGRSDRGGRGGRGNFRGGRGGPRTRSHRDNIKSDLTTQEESSDPVAIRKQVGLPIYLCRLLANSKSRSSSTFPMLTFLETNSSLAKSVAARTTLSSSRFCTPSNACATSSLSMLSWTL